jgi:type VI secretion system protein ImpK
MKLVDCFVPFFALVRQFQLQPGGDAAELASRLDALIASARQQARTAGYADADAEEALFAAAAWADEVVQACSWAGAADWQRRLLQRRYFNVGNAGMAFFERLDKLTSEQLDVREVYGLALSLGFAGRYGYDRNQKALTDIKRANLDMLLGDGMAVDPDRPIFPDGYGAAPGGAPTGKQRARRRVSLLAMTLLIPLLVLVVLYGVYYAVIWQLVDAILPQIRI